MLGSVPQPVSQPEASNVGFQSTETYRDQPVAGYRRRPGGTAMAGAAAIELTTAEVHQLTGLVRAGTTPQPLVPRTCVILGGSVGLGSRALPRREHMRRTAG